MYASMGVARDVLVVDSEERARNLFGLAAREEGDAGADLAMIRLCGDGCGSRGKAEPRSYSSR